MKNNKENNSRNQKFNIKKVVAPPKQGRGQLYKMEPYAKSDGIFPQAFTMALDMLSIIGEANIKEPTEEEEILEISESLVLVRSPKCANFYKYAFDIYLHGEEFGKIFTEPRILSEYMLKETCLIQVNWLYTQNWHETVMEVMENLNFKMRHISKLDIAIDGLNYMHGFLNMFNKQLGSDKRIRMRGKAYFNAKILDKETMLYKNFTVGSNSSEKQITVYLKTSELEKSNKDYIREFWYQNGIRPGPDDDVYRVELRLKSKYLKTLPDFNLHACTDPKFLFCLFKTACFNFFEFTSNDDSNVSRQKKIKLLPHEFMDSELLDRTQRPLSDDSYKAKMSIHLTVKNCLMGHLRDLDASDAIGAMRKNLELYNLWRWYYKRIDEWINLYNKLNSEGMKYKELESLKVQKSNTYQL